MIYLVYKRIVTNNKINYLYIYECLISLLFTLNLKYEP